MTGCGGADIMISNQIVEGPRPCTVFDIKTFRNQGAIAFWPTANATLRTVTSQQAAGALPWNGGDVPPPIILKRNQE